MARTTVSPLVGILMGSSSDMGAMYPAAEMLQRFNVPCELRVISAHRRPTDCAEYASAAVERGLRVLIAGAGGAAHLPGVLAAHTVLPVIGVPVAPDSGTLGGLDALLAIVQMPRGIPVATVAIGGGANAGILAAQILAVSDPSLRDQLVAYKQELAEAGRAQDRDAQRDAR